MLSAIIVSALVTYFLRALPFLIFQNRPVPAWLENLVKALPGAVMVVLVVYCLKESILLMDSSLLLSLAGVACAALTYRWKHSMFLSIFLSTVLYMVLIRLF